VQAATTEADELERELLAQVRALAPGTAQLIVAWSPRPAPLRSLRCPTRRRRACNEGPPYGGPSGSSEEPAVHCERIVPLG
jgi:hypothetical protein